MEKEFEFRIPFKGFRFLTVKAETLEEAQEIMINVTHQDFPMDDVITELYCDRATLTDLSGQDN